MTRWVLTIEVDRGSQPGLLARISRIFADRGISLADMLATEHQGRAVVLLSFEASERLRDTMVRRIGRLEEVTRVLTEPADSRRLWEYLEST